MGIMDRFNQDRNRVSDDVSNMSVESDDSVAVVDDLDDDEWVSVSNVAWNPVEAGDYVQGRLVEKRDGVGKHKQHVYVIEDSTGHNVDVWGRVQLDKLMADVDVNDMVRIKYMGNRNTKKNFAMQRFEVFTKK